MTTLLRITCFILSVVAVPSCAMLHDPPFERVVRVQALADPSFRGRNTGWIEELRARIEAASVYFEREFEIRFVTVNAAAWPERERIASTAGLMVKLKQDFPTQKNNGAFDIIVAFTAEPISRYLPTGRPRVDRIGDCRIGLGHYVVTTVSGAIRRTPEQPELDYDTVALIHELAHLFGAEHVQDTASIMHESFDYRSAFDMKNHATILRNRFCPFAK
ncbi:MAG TPA: M12 family metallo-peptidase [Candidatus Binatia bacterium]|nr:M12 family metallo-peptidase [Candidatus Binatia bacterium]